MLTGALALAFLITTGRWAVARAAIYLLLLFSVMTGASNWLLSEDARDAGVRELTWVDDAVGPSSTVAILWRGDRRFPPSHRTALRQSEFFNRSVGPVYDLRHPLAGGVPSTQAMIRGGVVVDSAGRPVRAGYVMAHRSLAVKGRPVARDRARGSSSIGSAAQCASSTEGRTREARMSLRTVATSIDDVLGLRRVSLRGFGRRAGNLLRIVVLLGSLWTLALARQKVPIWFLVAAVAVSLVAMYLIDRRSGRVGLWAAYLVGFVLFALLRSVADETDGLRPSTRWTQSGGCSAGPSPRSGSRGGSTTPARRGRSRSSSSPWSSATSSRRTSSRSCYGAATSRPSVVTARPCC